MSNTYKIVDDNNLKQHEQYVNNLKECIKFRYSKYKNKNKDKYDLTNLLDDIDYLFYTDIDKNDLNKAFVFSLHIVLKRTINKLLVDEIKIINNIYKLRKYVDTDCNINCTSCADCSYCIDCTNCVNCSNCLNCTNCEKSSDCINLTNCEKCYQSNDCTRCKKCFNCIRCERCEMCKELKDCYQRRDCVECVNCKNCIVSKKLITCEHCNECSECEWCNNCMKCKERNHASDIE